MEETIYDSMVLCYHTAASGTMHTHQSCCMYNLKVNEEEEAVSCVQLQALQLCSQKCHAGFQTSIIKQAALSIIFLCFSLFF